MSQKIKLILFFTLPGGILLFFLYWIVFQNDGRDDALAQWRTQQNLPGHLTITYPQSGTVFPPEIVAPTIHWDDEIPKVESWAIVINSQKGPELFSVFVNQNQWQPDSIQWSQAKKQGLKNPVEITVLGVRQQKIVSGAQTLINISRDSVGASVFYRSVPLPFSFALKNLDQIRWHLGEISSSKSPVTLLKNLPFCGNCHSFSHDAKTLAMDVDYANDKGSYVITAIEKETRLSPDEIITWSDFRPEDGTQTFGLLSQISPDGRYVVSTVKDRSIFVAKPQLEYSQLFFPIKGILAIYDRQKQNFFSLAGADDPEFVQSSPAWSPDGKFIYFARARAFHLPEAEQSTEAVLPTSVASIFIDGKQEFKYDICRVPFNDGRGGQAEAVPGAGGNGKSNYFPRISPDGKWLIFCRANNFMLLQPDAELFILPAAGGAPRRLMCNTASMNSWHSWSPNSKWLVFSSKSRGPCTDFWLTHIDENGQDSPPVLLENLSFPKRAGNIPEFVNRKPAEWTKITDDFSNQSHYFYTIGRYNVTHRKFNEALQAFNKAIQLDSLNLDAWAYKGHSEFSLERFSQAIVSYRKIIQLDPENTAAMMNLGAVEYKTKNYKKAVSYYNRVIDLTPSNGAVYFSRGSTRAKLDDYAGAIADFSRALENGYRSDDVYYERGLIYGLLKDFSGALNDLNKAIEVNPKNKNAYIKKGDCLYQTKRYATAVEAFSQAIKIDPNQREPYSSRGSCKAALNDYAGALHDFSQAILIAPNSALDYCKRGLIEIRLGQKEVGCQDLKKAAQLGYTRAEVEIEKNCL